MKGKIVIAKTDLKKMQSAAFFSGVKLSEAITIGDESHIEISARNLESIFKCGRNLERYDGGELDAYKVAVAKKEAVKKETSKLNKK